MLLHQDKIKRKGRACHIKVSLAIWYTAPRTKPNEKTNHLSSQHESVDWNSRTN